MRCVKIKRLLVSKILEEICAKLNAAGVDYYVVGAVGAYLDANLPFLRKHDDLDILVNENDVNKLPAIFNDMDFDFYDNRTTSTKVLNSLGYTDGEHEVYARHRASNFHIGFFLFYRDRETYTIVEYYQENRVQKKLERTLPIQFFDLQYNTRPILFHGIPLKTVRKETIYKNKATMRRDKDMFDRQQLEPKIDYDILGRLSGLHNYRVTKISDV